MIQTGFRDNGVLINPGRRNLEGNPSTLILTASSRSRHCRSVRAVLDTFAGTRARLDV